MGTFVRGDKYVFQGLHSKLQTTEINSFESAPALTEKGQDEQFSKTLNIAVSFLFFDNLHNHSSFRELFVNVFTVLMLAQFWRPGPLR